MPIVRLKHVKYGTAVCRYETRAASFLDFRVHVDIFGALLMPKLCNVPLSIINQYLGVTLLFINGMQPCRSPGGAASNGISKVPR